MSSLEPGATIEEKFLAHLGRSGELINARRLEEAEVEVLRALSVQPGERRALNLLALVRFKLGRIEESHEAYREIAMLAPDDPGVRLNMGLLALKLERFAEAIESLELAGKLQPADLRVWSYLGFAYSRMGQPALAVASFRRAGQEDLAREIERAEHRADGGAEPAPSPGGADIGPAAGPSASAATTIEMAPVVVELAEEPVAVQAAHEASDAFAAVQATMAGLAMVPTAVGPPVPLPPDGGAPHNLATFALRHLLSPQSAGAAIAAARAGVFCVQVRDEAYVRSDAAMAHAGQISWEPGRRRVRGRLQMDALGSAERPLYRLRGRGEVWVALARGQVVALTLEDDMLYLREDRVVAFDGDVAWEAGRLPRDGLRLVQFRGKGRVAVEVAGEPLTLRLEPDRPARVARDRMLGWIGRVQPHGVGPARPGAADEVSCEGEGVVLLETAGAARG